MPKKQRLISASCWCPRRHVAGARSLVAVITGGFSVFARHVRILLNFDTVVANDLGVERKVDGNCGRTHPDEGGGKRAALISLAAEQGIPLRLTLAVGDGATGLPMLEAAGLGVAFHAKPALANFARYRVDYGNLTSLLYAQGYRATEFAAA